MKKILIALFFTTICFSQEKVTSISQIDSICLMDETYRSNLDGIINVKDKNKKIIGEGGYSISLYFKYSDEEFFKKLNNDEKKKYNRKKNIQLIKGFHHQVIHYKNSFSDNVFSEFYYKNQELFYIKIKFIRTENSKKDKILNYELTNQELENFNVIKNEFSFNLKKWVNEKNIEIQEFSKQN